MDKRTKEYKELMKKQIATQKQEYRVVLRINGQETESIKESLEEAILAVKPEFFKSNAVLRVFHNEKQAEKLLNIVRIKRLFTGKIFRDFIIKNIILQMK